MLGYKGTSFIKNKCTEMRMVRWICGNIMRDKLRNEDIRANVGVTLIDEKM